MKFWLCLLVFLLTGNTGLRAQKEDYVWLAGFGSQYAYDTANQQWYGMSKFNFNQQPVGITPDSFSLDIDESNAAISDANGNLLFATNGVKVYNSISEKMEGGDSIGVGYATTFLYPFGLLVGYPYPEVLLVLPNPLSLSSYDIFTSYQDTFDNNNADLRFRKLLKTTLDVSANNQHGKVIQKDKVVFEHETNGSIMAVRHANGKDWWLCTYRVGSNCYDIILYNGSDNVRSAIYCGGGQIPRGWLGSNRFSMDGSKFIMASITGEISIFDFDRCSGVLSLKEMFMIPEIADSTWYPHGTEFSPDSRFAYIFCSAKIYQIDLDANPIVNSLYTVASYNGAYGTNSPDYYYAQLAPDGKVYINSGTNNNYLSVIENPNGQGASCSFRDTLQIPTYISGLPHYPNYRLGALPGSPCDTLTGLNDIARAEKEKLLKVFPNPATNFITIDYGFTDWNKGEVSLEITNELGQVVHQQPVPMYSGFQKVEVQNFAPGMYTAFIKRKGQVVASAKFARL
jgi:hypothetical protein